MKEIVLLTNTACHKRQNSISKTTKGIINFAKMGMACITKKKDHNMGIIRNHAKVVVIDPSSVPQKTAETYQETIGDIKWKINIVILGDGYRIPGIENISCWKKIRELASAS